MVLVNLIKPPFLSALISQQSPFPRLHSRSGNRDGRKSGRSCERCSRSMQEERGGSRVVNRISFQQQALKALPTFQSSEYRIWWSDDAPTPATNGRVDGRKLRDYYLSFYAPKFLIPISCSRLSVVMSHFLIRTRSATIMQ